LISPLCYIFGYTSFIKIIYPNASSINTSHIDFWGPCGIISLYGAILWIAKVKNVPWLYVIWFSGSMFNHLVSRVWYRDSSILLHLSVLGYSLISVVPITAILLIVKFSNWTVLCIKSIALFLSSFSAILSYYSALKINEMDSTNVAPRINLLVAPVVLTHLYALSLMP
jgi:hypothetical protein